MSMFAGLGLEGSASSSVDNADGGGAAVVSKANSTNMAVARMPSRGSSAGSFEEWGAVGK